jgi:Sec-independent protein translocase protein TatA
VFGLTFPKLALIGIIAVVIIGPERLPAFAARLASFVKMIRTLADTARERVKEEMGPEFDDVDWTKLDPRQYDPRRIIREALLGDGDDEDDEDAEAWADPDRESLDDDQPGKTTPTVHLVENDSKDAEEAA